MTQIRYIPNRVIDHNGISDGAQLFVYQSGTTTKVPIFSDNEFSIPIVNPVTVPSGAEVPLFYTSYAGLIRLRIVESNGDVSMDEDPYSAPAGVVDVTFIQAGAGSVARTITDKAADIIDPRDKGAVMDGSTDDRLALMAADAAGPVRISKPIYISSDVTLNNPVEFVGSGRIVGPSTVTVSLPSGINAHRRLIFDGVRVSGLQDAWLEWFANDVKSVGSVMPTVVANSRIQRAFDAVSGGLLRAGKGNWLIDGSVINCDLGASFEGAGEGVTGTRFYWNGATRNFLSRLDTGAGIRGGFWSRFSLQAIDGGASDPIAGTALYVNQSAVTVESVIISNPFDGVMFDTSYISRCYNVTINDPRNVGKRIKNSLDVFVDKWNVSALGDRVSTTATPAGGAFVVGEAVNCPTGSSGTVIAAFSPTNYRISWVGIRPPVGATITAAGKSATVNSVTVGCALGQFRIEGTCESVVIGDGDGIGGEYGLLVAGAGAPGRITGNSGYNVVQDGAYFDTTYQGSVFDGGYGWTVDGWFATSRNQDAKGLAFLRSRQCSGTPRCENNAGSGLWWDDSNQGLDFVDKCVGNGRNFTSPNTADITVSGPAQRWSLELRNAGSADPSGRTAPKGLYIDNISAANFTVVNKGASPTAIVNASTSSAQAWIGQSGPKPPISPAVDGTSTAVTLTAGGTYEFPNFSGLVAVNNNSNGAQALYNLAGGNTLTVSATPTSPGGFTFSSGKYIFTATSSGTFAFATIKLRAQV